MMTSVFKGIHIGQSDSLHSHPESQLSRSHLGTVDVTKNNVIIAILMGIPDDSYLDSLSAMMKYKTIFLVKLSHDILQNWFV
jgi:hypothetical protein